MYRTTVVRALLVGIAALALATGCGGGEEKSAQNQPQPATSQPKGQSRSLLEETQDSTVAERPDYKDLFIRPYFDKEGTVTEKAVAAGEEFSFYVVAEDSKPYGFAAAEYRVSVPEGIKVNFEEKMENMLLDIGDYDKRYVVAYRCTKKNKYMLRKYNCEVLEAFGGGKISTDGAIAPSGSSFLGFVSCDSVPRFVHKAAAEGGSAVLTVK